MSLDDLLTAALLALALFLGMSGVGMFVVGVIASKGASWIKQYAYAAVCLTCAYYLFRLVFDTP